MVTLRAWDEKNIAAWPAELPAPTMWISRPCVLAASSVEVDVMRRRVEPGDRPWDDDLGAEPARLLERSARQLLARHARGEAEGVLRAGGGGPPAPPPRRPPPPRPP